MVPTATTDARKRAALFQGEGIEALQADLLVSAMSAISGASGINRMMRLVLSTLRMNNRASEGGGNTTLRDGIMASANHDQMVPLLLLLQNHPHRFATKAAKAERARVERRLAVKDARRLEAETIRSIELGEGRTQ
jgi:hypothetical protein